MSALPQQLDNGLILKYTCTRVRCRTKYNPKKRDETEGRKVSPGFCSTRCEKIVFASRRTYVPRRYKRL